MTKFDNKYSPEDGIPLLRDMVSEEISDDLPPLFTHEERLAFIEKLALELQNSFKLHTYQVMHGILDGSPEQQDQQLYLRLRELLKESLPENLHATQMELKQDESDS